MAKSKWYKIENRLDEIYNWIKKGKFEYEIVKLLGISKPTWEKYKKENNKLAELMYRAKLKRSESLIPELETALVKVALGYEEESEVREEQSKDDEGNVTIKKVTIRKKYAPNVNAINTLLKNFTRSKPKGQKWADEPAELDIKEEKLELEKKAAKMKEEGWD